jgi:TetR/AcrR family transcriptional regulator
VPNKPPEPRQRLSSEERRAEIIRAARETFVEFGPTGARTRTIAERAGITEPALYRHFRSKEELYRVAIEQPLAEMLDDVVAQAARLGADDTMTRDECLDAVNRLFLRAMLELGAMAGPSLYAEMAHGKRFYQSVVRPRLRDAFVHVYGRLTGRPLPDGDIGLLVIVFLGIHSGIAVDAVMSGRTVDIADAARHINALVGLPSPSTLE